MNEEIIIGDILNKLRDGWVRKCTVYIEGIAQAGSVCVYSLSFKSIRAA